MPLQEVALRAVYPVFGEVDDLPCPGVELVTITEVLTQSRANEQTVPGINADVSTVEEGVNVRPEQQSVVEAVLAARCDGPNVRSLQNRCYVCSADGAAAVIGIEDYCLK